MKRTVAPHDITALAASLGLEMGPRDVALITGIPEGTLRGFFDGKVALCAEDRLAIIMSIVLSHWYEKEWWGDAHETYVQHVQQGAQLPWKKTARGVKRELQVLRNISKEQSAILGRTSYLTLRHEILEERRKGEVCISTLLVDFD